MLSTKKSRWIKPLALLLVCGLIMGCFAGCAEGMGKEVKSLKSKPDVSDETEQDQLPDETLSPPEYLEDETEQDQLPDETLSPPEHSEDGSEQDQLPDETLSLPEYSEDEPEQDQLPNENLSTPAYPEVEPTRKAITLKVWAPVLDQGEGSWLEDRLTAFETAHPELDITWKIGVCYEGDTGTQIAADPSVAADVYMYISHELDTLYSAGALAQLGGTYLEQVETNYSKTFVNTVTYTDGGVYGFPMTGNTWFMYYNKDTYTEEDIKTMDSLMAKGTVAMQMGTAWYTGSFFTSNGCEMFGSSGVDASAGIQFGGQRGYASALAMVDLVANGLQDDVNASGVAGMINGTVDAMFSGWWDYDALYMGLGDKLGCAPLPTITIAGKQVQLKALAGSRAIGVNPHCKNQKEAMQLAAFLASEESQLRRFELRGITPAHKNLANNKIVTASQVAVAEMAVMNNCSVAQPSIPEMSAFWGPMGTFGSAVMNGDITVENYKDQVDLLYSQLNSDGL